MLKFHSTVYAATSIVNKFNHSLLEALSSSAVNGKLSLKDQQKQTSNALCMVLRIQLDKNISICISSHHNYRAVFYCVISRRLKLYNKSVPTYIKYQFINRIDLLVVVWNWVVRVRIVSILKKCFTSIIADCSSVKRIIVIGCESCLHFLYKLLFCWFKCNYRK